MNIASCSQSLKSDWQDVFWNVSCNTDTSKHCILPTSVSIDHTYTIIHMLTGKWYFYKYYYIWYDNVLYRTSASWGVLPEILKWILSRSLASVKTPAPFEWIASCGWFFLASNSSINAVCLSDSMNSTVTSVTKSIKVKYLPNSQ